MNRAEWTDAAAAAGVAIAVSTIVTGVAARFARRRGLLDVPNERSSHDLPTPRVGGIGLLCGMFAALLFALAPGGEAFIPLIAACFLGLFDDRHPLPPIVKMAGLLLIAVIPVLYETARLNGVVGVPYAGTVEFGWWGIPLTLFWLSSYPNAFNFMDGINGIAALTALVSGGVFVVAGIRGNDTTLASWGIGCAGASLGFLPWNFPKASTFMGDGGSLPLGLLLAMCAVQAERAHALPFPACVLLLGPFLFDVTFTLFRRWREGKTIGAPHKEHLYQRLSRVWDSHAKVSLLYAGFSVATGVLALNYAAMTDTGKLLSLVLPTLAMLGFAALVLRAERVKGR